MTAWDETRLWSCNFCKYEDKGKDDPFCIKCVQGNYLNSFEPKGKKENI
jgi:hypothetical protein